MQERLFFLAEIRAHFSFPLLRKELEVALFPVLFRGLFFPPLDTQGVLSFSSCQRLPLFLDPDERSLFLFDALALSPLFRLVDLFSHRAKVNSFLARGSPVFSFTGVARSRTTPPFLPGAAPIFFEGSFPFSPSFGGYPLSFFLEKGWHPFLPSPGGQPDPLSFAAFSVQHVFSADSPDSPVFLSPLFFHPATFLFLLPLIFLSMDRILFPRVRICFSPFFGRSRTYSTPPSV